MREIKFRAWDKTNKRMSDNFTLFDIYAGHDESTIPDKDNMTFYFGNNELYDLDIMQYTGIKDKNGKEIYEADIVRETWESGSEVTNRVYWTEIDIRDEFIRPMGWSIGIKEDMEYEVIGNIWENPELLK